MTKRSLTFAFLLAGLFAHPAMAQESTTGIPVTEDQVTESLPTQIVVVETVKDLALTCVGCHGEQFEGFEDLRAPRLAGQDKTYLAEQMVNYRKGARGYAPDDVRGLEMRAFTEALSDEDIERLADYLSGQSAGFENQTVAAGDVVRGQQFYDGSCAACHGLDGTGSAHVLAPNLKILSAWYIKDQMAAYDKGWRGGDTHGTTRSKYMRSFAQQFIDASIRDDMTAYIHSLRSAP